MTNAIETAAYGRLFRSRLEARFAVFFTHLNLEWQYEPEGYKLPSGYYLPDFLVNFPDEKSWIEIKQFNPNDIEKQKAQQLANLTGNFVLIHTYQDLVNWANDSKSKLNAAAIAALSQRFEHGKSPA